MENETKIDVYQKVTDQIVAAIEAGVDTWRMPWHTTGKDAFSPINASSRKAYRGVNTLCLWAAANAKGYTSGEWGTYKQWQEKGAQVRKGEKATTVVFWKFGNGAEKQDGEEGEIKLTSDRLIFTRGYSVFNAAQVDGYTPAVEEAPTTTNERIDAAEQFFARIGADVREGVNRAYYTTMDDHIQMPPFHAFVDGVSFYSTLAHEHTHWTATRVGRELGKRFGDNAYAAEELVAELGAAFVCAELGLTTVPREDHAQYLASWLKVLKADKRAIFTAASKAQQATDFLVKKAAGEEPARVAA